MLDQPIVRIVTSREPNDCAIVALAMITGRSYEDVLRVVTRQVPSAGKNGLWLARIMRIAGELGVPLKKRTRFDLETDTGLLSVWLTQMKDHHLVMVVPGYLIDDGMLWEPDVYCRQFAATPKYLLVRSEDANVPKS